MDDQTGEALEQELRAFRHGKDAFMKGDPQSPLGPEQRRAFTGLLYYPFNPALRLILPLERAVSRDVISMETSTAEQQDYRRAGTIRFQVDHQTAELVLYQGPQGELFLPLRDATSGHDTYGAGRYLEPDLIDEERVLVDFNYLYNPYCAYNEGWSCPLPPRENWLGVPLTAGEKIFGHA